MAGSSQTSTVGCRVSPAAGTSSEGHWGRGAVPRLGQLLQRPLPSAAAPVLSPQSGRPSLKLLAERILGIRVQQAEHCSVSVFWGAALGTGVRPWPCSGGPCHLVADIVGPG